MNKPLQGRSLIAAPWEIVKQVSATSDKSPRIITATFDLDELREFRQRLNRSAEPFTTPLV
jgi:predicted amidohydrolase